MGKVTKDDVDKAEAEWDTAASKAAEAGWMNHSAADAAFAAFDKYIKLKEAFENGNQRGCREG